MNDTAIMFRIKEIVALLVQPKVWSRPRQVTTLVEEYKRLVIHYKGSKEGQ